jgi:hypothetical protein
MDEVSAFLAQYGLIVLFLVVFAEQIGLPLPGIPVLLAAGALAGADKMNLAVAVLVSVVACMAGDVGLVRAGPAPGPAGTQHPLPHFDGAGFLRAAYGKFLHPAWRAISRLGQVHSGIEYAGPGACRIVPNTYATISPLQRAGCGPLDPRIYHSRLSAQRPN